MSRMSAAVGALVAGAVALGAGAAGAQSLQGDGALRRPGSGAGEEAALGAFFAAEVASDGTLVSGAGAISAARTGDCPAGCYEVIFRRNNLHRACWWTATVGGRSLGTGNPGPTIAVEPRIGTNNGLFVGIRGASGALTDAPFLVAVLCR